MYELKDVGSGSYGIGPTIVATALAFVTGYAAIAWLLRYLVDHSVTLFVVYRVALGILVLVLLAAGAMGAQPARARRLPRQLPRHGLALTC